MTQRKTDPAMGDLETMGISPNSVILSIGAVRFDEESNTVHDPFYVVINTQSCLDVGMEINTETELWWASKPEDARRVIEEAKNSPITIHQALNLFNEWIEGAASLWGNGNDFDNAMLQEAMRKCGIEQGWPFWNNRCYRTMKNMFPVSHKRAGTHHNALDDATYQAEHMLKILAKMRSR